MFRKSLIYWLLVIVLAPYTARAQKPEAVNAAELMMRLKKLNTLGSVLYIAAHPDDENTRLIAWFSKERLYHTAYLSLTRGDGGQNLIGPEIRETLGLIRTYELLAARRIDGGRQFFTRANDFGYSKTAGETFAIWDSVQVMSDMIWTIRRFRPDVVVTRFNGEVGGGHGHHTASALLAEKAFYLAGDPNVFKEQSKYVEPWSPARMYWNTSRWFYSDGERFDSAKMAVANVGGYNPALGKSYTEIAAEARSMHRSQGFGSASSRGDAFEYLMPIANAKPGEDPFAGIDVSWNRLKGGSEVGRLLQQAVEEFDPENPHLIVPILLQAREKMLSLEESHWKVLKLEELDQLVKACMGLFLEALANQHTAAAGDSLKISLEATNRSSVPAVLKEIKLTGLEEDALPGAPLPYNRALRFETTAAVPAGAPLSQPYWLRKGGSNGMYKVDDQLLRGLPEEPAYFMAEFAVNISGQDFIFKTPVIFKEVDPAYGEIYKPLRIVPPAFITLDRQAYVFANPGPDTIRATVRAGKNGVSALIAPEVPSGWKISPRQIPVELAFKGQEAVVAFQIIPPTAPATGEIRISANVDGKDYSYSMIEVEYDHIPPVAWFPEAKSKIVKLDLKKKGSLIGYVAGAGDAVAASLRWIGYEVRRLGDDDFKNNHLRQYDAIILGVRAYNVNESLRRYQHQLFDYVRHGGVIIVQYNVDRGLVVDDIAPYPLQLSRERVTDEQAEVKILDPKHPAMNYPNKITSKDFEGWVQERGLYFANKWDPAFVPLLSSHDEGEKPLEGGLLAAKYGEGYYVYTGYSWFRQLPAGVPGAFRILANLIALGQSGEMRP